MAKLNVVIPAVNVTVNGIEYRKVERKAQAGDIVKALSEYEDITAGAFYGPVYADIDGDLTVHDDANEEHITFISHGKHEVYAPITAETPATPSGQITFEGASYRKVGRSAREGDVIVFTEEADYITEGEPYAVTRIDGAGDVHVDDDDGDDLDTCGKEFDVYEKVSEVAANAPVGYREAKRQAMVGERIKIVAASGTGGYYVNGTELTVTSVNRDNPGALDHVKTAEVAIAILDTEYVVLEPRTTVDTYIHNGVTYRKESRVANVGELVLVVANTMGGNSHGYDIGDVTEIVGEWPVGSYGAQRKGSGKSSPFMATADYVVLVPVTPATTPPATHKYSVGDYVKVTGNSVGHNYTEGSVVKITETRDSVEQSQIIYAEKSNGTRGNALVTKDVEPADEAAFSAQKPQPKRPTVGDYVKVIAAGGGHNYAVGSVVKITINDGSGVPYRAEKADGSEGNWLTEEQLVPATEADFLAQRKPAEPVRLKIGDFARVIVAADGHNFVYGAIAEVIAADSSSLPYLLRGFNGYESWMFASQVTPASPEEVSAAQSAAEYAKRVGSFSDGDFAVIAAATSANANQIAVRNAGAYVTVKTEGESGHRGLRLTLAGGTLAGYANADALRQITEAEYIAATAPKPAFSVGDSVKLTVANGESPHYSWGSVKNGDVGTVSAVLSDKIQVDFPKQSRWNAKPAELTKVATGAPRLQVGEYARTLVTKDVPFGAIVKIERDDHDSTPFKGVQVNGRNWDWYKPSELEKVDASEMQEIARWAAVGRKVNEYKAGDIVAVTDASCLSGGTKIKNGDIVMLGVGDVSDDAIFRLLAPGVTSGNYASAKRFKLVTPVEQRFDTEQIAEKAAVKSAA